MKHLLLALRTRLRNHRERLDAETLFEMDLHRLADLGIDIQDVLLAIDARGRAPRPPRRGRGR